MAKKTAVDTSRSAVHIAQKPAQQPKEAPFLPMISAAAIGDASATKPHAITFRVEEVTKANIDQRAARHELTASALLFALVLQADEAAWSSAAEKAIELSNDSADVQKLKNHRRVLQHRLRKLDQQIQSLEGGQHGA